LRRRRSNREGRWERSSREAAARGASSYPALMMGEGGLRGVRERLQRLMMGEGV